MKLILMRLVFVFLLPGSIAVVGYNVSEYNFYLWLFLPLLVMFIANSILSGDSAK